MTNSNATSLSELALYAALLFGVLLVAWSAYGFLAPNGPIMDSSGQVLKTAANQQYFASVAAQSGNTCGDLKDTQNVQHLSHHPGQYADCLKQVDPAFLQQATGKTYQQIVGG